MTIRKKIFLLAGVLLAMFGAVVGILAIVQRLNGNRISDAINYELPLTRMVAEFDVDTDRFELRTLRALRLDPISALELKAAIADLRILMQEMRADVATSAALLDRAAQDSKYQTSARVDLARLEGSFKLLSRNLDGFLGVGEATMNALADGRIADARTAALGFAGYSDAFGPDLSDIRVDLAGLTDRAARMVLASQRLDTYMSFALFIVACGIGIGISAIGSTRVVGGLRVLVAGTRNIESGAAWVPLTIRTRDEVGELATSFNRMVEELRSREQIKDTFGKFVDPRIVSRLIGSGADQAERRTLTVFFSDIKEFSGISEQLTASAIVNLLNSYFGAVAGVIHAHNGVIDKYIGDAVMAFWIPPFSAGDNHASDACLAALDQQLAIATLREKLPEITGMRRNAPNLVIRMGIATGEAVVGTIGSEAARSYTVVGDTANLASRLESVNKVYGTSIILSEETYRLAQQVIEARELDLMTVAGKTEPVRIYEAMGRAGELAPERIELRNVFAAGLAAYRRCDWDEATTQFQSCLRIVADDGPAGAFLARIALYRSAPPPADWGGIWHASEK